MIILVVIYYSQEELIKNYYYEYTNKIGYKDLIIGSSSDIIEKHCQEKPDEPGWSGPMYICYNDQSWMYKFIIRNNKIQSYFMAEMYDDDAKPEVKFRHNSVSISPIINTLDRRYVLDKNQKPIQTHTIQRKLNGYLGIIVYLWSCMKANMGILYLFLYQDKYALDF